MKDEKKSKEQLIDELVEMRERITQMKAVESDRKQVEEALRESEEKYRTLLKNLPQKIFFKNRNSVYVSCNDNYAKDLKIKSEEIAGRKDYEFYPKELAEKYRADDRRIMKSGETEEIEERHIQEGQEFIVQTVKTPVKDEKGDVVGILGIFWDITERKRVEEALKEAKEQAEAATRAKSYKLCLKIPVLSFGYNNFPLYRGPPKDYVPKPDLLRLTPWCGHRHI